MQVRTVSCASPPSTSSAPRVSPPCTASPSRSSLPTPPTSSTLTAIATSTALAPTTSSAPTPPRDVPTTPLRRPGLLCDELNADLKTGQPATYRVADAVEPFAPDHQEALGQRNIGD